MKIRVFTAFSGYDSQCLALDRLRKTYHSFEYEFVGWAETDKYAINAHNALFPECADRNFGDISKIDWENVPDFDLFTYSSPCQDFSIAGLQRGGTEGSGTRSSLLWECRRAILAKKPKFLLLENVTALVSKKFLPLFNKWLAELDSYGYANYASVLDAKNYGVPQHRPRIFVVSIRGENNRYHFPQPFQLERKLKDVLEKEVDEKFYLSDTVVKVFEDKVMVIQKGEEKPDFISRGCQNDSYNRVLKPDGYCGSRNCTKEVEILEPMIKQVGNIVEEKGFSNPQRGRVYDIEGISPAICTMTSGGTEPKILIPKPTKQYECYYRIRKLTPRECFRLMGVNDADIDRIQAHIANGKPISSSQQYKMAGNSIVVDVLFHIFRKMFVEIERESRQLELF